MAEIRLEKSKWRKFCDKYPQISEFLVFFIISNGVTVLQMILVPLIKYLFSFTDLVNTAFQVLPIGQNLEAADIMCLIMQPEVFHRAAEAEWHTFLQ